MMTWSGFWKKKKVNNKNTTTTVSMLIDILKQMPGDLPVLVSGYESGFEHFYPPCVKKLKYEPENKYYEGEYQQLSNTNEQSISAVVLSRVVRDD